VKLKCERPRCVERSLSLCLPQVTSTKTPCFLIEWQVEMGEFCSGLMRPRIVEILILKSPQRLKPRGFHPSRTVCDPALAGHKGRRLFDAPSQRAGVPHKRPQGKPEAPVSLRDGQDPEAPSRWWMAPHPAQCAPLLQDALLSPGTPLPEPTARNSDTQELAGTTPISYVLLMGLFGYDCPE
jgi:hypothetical protein